MRPVEGVVELGLQAKLDALSDVDFLHRGQVPLINTGRAQVVPGS